MYSEQNKTEPFHWLHWAQHGFSQGFPSAGLHLGNSLDQYAAN